MRLAENQSFFLLKEASISQMSFLSLPLGLALVFPSLAYYSIPVGVGGFLWIGRAWMEERGHPHGCLENSGIAAVKGAGKEVLVWGVRQAASPGEQRCRFFSGVVILCIIPSHPGEFWLAAGKIFSSITIFSAFLRVQHPFNFVAWHMTWKTANSVLKLLS